MAKINIPKNANNFDVWFSNFQKTFNRQARQFGFTATDIKNVNQFFQAWRATFQNFNEFNQFEKSFNAVFTAQFGLFQTFVQNYWNQISAHPNFNGNAQAWFGSTAPSRVSMTTTKNGTTRSNSRTTSTRSTVKKSTSPIRSTKSTTVGRTSTKTTTRNGIKSINRTNGRSTNVLTNNGTPIPTNSPFVWFSSGKSGIVNVYVGGTKNGNFHLPTGATGTMVQYRYGRVSWRKLGEGNSVPFTHNTNGIDANKITYRACWIFGNKKGPWSATSHFSIATSKAA